MILKASQRAGGQQLATHLLNSHDNERVEIADVRDSIAQDPHGAFAEWYACSKGTKCRKYLYSLSISPDRFQGGLTREQYFDFIGRVEARLRLGQLPRVVVFHDKRDKDGVPREHCHVVWSRIDTARMKAIHISHDRQKLQAIARDFARDHGLTLPEGMRKDPQKDKTPNEERFKDRKKRENHQEKQQQERSGISKAQRMADISQAWKDSHDGDTLVKKLEKRGYFLARGDKRSYVVIDLHGEIHSLSRQLDGVKAQELRDRLAASHPILKIGDVKAVQEHARTVLEHERTLIRAARGEAERRPEVSDPGLEAHARRRVLEESQARRRMALDGKRLKLKQMHTVDREALTNAHLSEMAAVNARRQEAKPKGLLAFLGRITGVQMFIERRHRSQDQQRADEHARQLQALDRRHQREMHEFEGNAKALARVEKREMHSFKTALRREEAQRLLEERSRRNGLRPLESDKTHRKEERVVDGSQHNIDGKTPLADLFKNAAHAKTREHLKPIFDKAAEKSQPTKAATNRGVQNNTVKLTESFQKASEGSVLPPDLAIAFKKAAEPARTEPDRGKTGRDRGLEPKR